MNPLISIIIPCKDIDQQTSECIQKCKELDYDNFEIIVLPDHEHSTLSQVKIVATGEVSPGKKRNTGEKNSTGEFLAFIDSDAYPQKEWLKNAMRYFNDSDIAAVGGPGITPEEDPILEKAGGYVLSSFMMGGLSNRFRLGKSIVSKDIHSCNFIARRSIIEKIGGWNERYWPGEDTLICLNIEKAGKKMLESIDVVVYHHRRPLFTKHLKQVSRFGMHRGFFAKRFPETSLRFNYFIPSILVVFMLIGSVFSFFEKSFLTYFIYILGIYLLAVLVASVLAFADGKDMRLIPLVFAGTIVTHLIYGIYFIAGLLSSELER
ncbi:MAG: glycosyltransferase [Euryarchaeota archaeon]|nr:glycosyltransferase [Euryarchaeota archaeon]